MSVTLTGQETAYFKAMVPDLAEEIIFIDRKAIRLEREWQRKLVGSTNNYEAYNKARQIGYSWATALRVLLRAHLFPPASYNAVFVSINREEAREKIRYVEQLYDGMKKRKKKITANRLEIELDTGNRIQSFPSRSVRGIPDVDLYLDEFAHIKDARTIYAGSTASTVRQSYGVTIGSTPFGRGPFYDVINGGGEFKQFVVNTIPWWDSNILCRDTTLARVFAPGMRTVERVQEYALPNLMREFDNHSLETFQTEFEAAFHEYGNSVLTSEMILSCLDGDLSCPNVEIDCDDSRVNPMEVIKEKIKEMMYEEDITDGFIGYDVGREIHASELILLSWRGGRLPTRFYLTLRKAPYPVQRMIITEFMHNLPIRKCVIDSQGIGNQLAQELQMTFSDRVYPMNFTELTKATMVGMLVKAFEDKLIKLYPTRRLNTQLLEVRKIFSVTGRILYRSAVTSDTSGGKEFKSHADIFWSLAMAIFGAQDCIQDRGIRTTSRSPLLSRLFTPITKGNDYRGRMGASNVGL